MFKFVLLPPYNMEDEDLPKKGFVSQEKDVVDAYKSVRDFIFNNPLCPNLIRISHVLDENNNVILVDDIINEINERYTAKGSETNGKSENNTRDC